MCKFDIKGKTYFVVISFIFQFSKFNLVNAASTIFYGGYDDRMDYYELPTSTNKTITDNLSYYRVHSHFVTIICSPLSRQWDRLPIGTGHSSVLLYKTTAA